MGIPPEGGTLDNREPPDHVIHSSLMIDHELLGFFVVALRHYEAILESDVKAVSSDPDLTAILGNAVLRSYPIAGQLAKTKDLRKALEALVVSGKGTVLGHDVTMTHGGVRFLKSVGVVYLEHLVQRRDVLASRSSTSRDILEAVDQQIGSFKERMQLGIFRLATPVDLMAIDGERARNEMNADGAQKPELPRRPVVLNSIEVRDLTLRTRCLDLLAQFTNDGQSARLDTVVTEATRILEDRLRILSGAPPAFAGDIAKYAFGGPTPRLVVSPILAEQEAAHLLMRGFFGFVRNAVHHRLVGTLQPERVLQIVGMADYLISVAEAAQREAPESEGIAL